MMSPHPDKWGSLGTPRICVVGDLILDRYLWTTAERVSPEAPVLVLQAEGEEDRLGGAASVAALLRGLACEVDLIGVVGSDSEGQRLRELSAQADIGATAIHTDPDRPTTLKSRILGRTAQRQPHQLLRIDRESRLCVNEALAHVLIEAVAAALPHADAVLISDYGKGVCTPALLGSIFDLTRKHNIPVAADPAKGVAFERYRGAPVLTPNRAEASAAAGRPIAGIADAGIVGSELCQAWGFPSIVVKLDRDGLVVCQSGTEPRFISTTPRTVCDVTGAGDMILAVLGLCLASGWTLTEAATMANVAAGLEVERVGVSPISREEVAAAIQGHPSKTTHHKLITVEAAAALATSYRSEGRRIVFTNGCFDLLHAGHVHCLEQAAAYGDVLFVAINSDNSARRLKGSSRPIIPQEQRITILAALACIDHVILMDDDTPHDILRSILPHVLVKGAPYTPEQVIGAEVVLSYGGKVAVTQPISGLSTSILVQTIARGHPID